MKMIASREMAAKPAAVWKSLKEDGAVIVTKNGQPEGIFFGTSEDTWLEDVREVLFARARRGASQIRQAAVETGVSRLTEEEIEAEIKAERADRS